MKLYCPICRELYEPEDERLAQIDGACFGPNFAHILLTYMNPQSHKFKKYVPRIYGFKVKQSGRKEERRKIDELMVVKKKEESRALISATVSTDHSITRWDKINK